MKWTRQITLLFLAPLLASCTSTATPIATGGSKADGIVRMSYKETALTSVEVDYTAMEVTATRRCRAWGYSEAEAFGGETRECVAQHAEYGCLQNRVSIEYQCIGSKTDTMVSTEAMYGSKSNPMLSTEATDQTIVGAVESRFNSCKVKRTECDKVCSTIPGSIWDLDNPSFASYACWEACHTEFSKCFNP